ncbi:hypothetical protein AWC38_SpisGene12707 [Stylophora pistillata]|uniref:PiggyBac transposable element-derived protein domain-containing protein n=1 Tax=Stylophora pistillata TaxID=50429 RepID=A0A2B4S028_STYPI|nr:hypothetical protein AWC38_SpisGene12707 [Stylophora pistillata]
MKIIAMSQTVRVLRNLTDFEGLASQSENESDEESSSESEDETPWSQDFEDLVINNFTTTLGIKNTYACGTVCCNRKDLPPCAIRKLTQGDIATAQHGLLVFTKWHDKQEISFLSKNVSHSEPSRPVQQKKKGNVIEIQKPQVAHVYTAFMGGVDHADQLRSFYYAGWQS